MRFLWWLVIRWSGVLVVVASLALTLLASRDAVADPPPNAKRDGGLQNALNALNDRARAYGLLNQAPPGDPTPLVSDNFEVLGHNDLGGQDTSGDVWVHGNFAYIGSFGGFGNCTRRGPTIIDVSDLLAPRVIGSLPSPLGADGQDVVVRHVSTASFEGDLAAVGIQRCGERRSLDRAQFGVDFWDVTNPYHPRKLSTLGLTNGGGGVHELDLFQRGDNVYALLATPMSEWFDPVPGGDFRIVEATDPRHPAQVGEWGAGAHGLSPGPFYGQGSFGSAFDHSARASADGTKAYLSYWDLGVITLDISDVTNPTLISRTLYPADAEGEAHSVAEYASDNGLLLLQNDEDFDPLSPAHILYGPGPTVGIGAEGFCCAPLWEVSGHSITAAVVEAANEGCTVGDYPADTTGKIAVVRTPFPFLDPVPADEPICFPSEQELAAEAAGAAAVVHDFISTATSPQPVDFAEVFIPALYTDHATAQGMVAAGEATLEAQEPSWGFLRVFDAATGVQIAKFDGAPNVHEFPPPDGFWSIHNTEVSGDRAYVAWYSNGIVALDLSPLNAATPGDPVMVGQFVPPGGHSPVPFFPENVPIVWGVAVREADGVIFVSDIVSGLWIVRPTGPAAP